eukprot:scaffold62197_cov81-Phaeocystis_antarctica.AAC.1
MPARHLAGSERPCRVGSRPITRPCVYAIGHNSVHCTHVLPRRRLGVQPAGLFARVAQVVRVRPRWARRNR